MLDEATCQQTLSLTHQTLGEKTAVAIAEGLRGDTYFNVVELADSYIGDVGCTALCGVLSEHPNIHTLVLKGNNIRSDGAQALALLLQQTRSLTHLSLEWNNIGTSDMGFAMLMGALPGHRTLRHLDLRNNHITADGAEVLCRNLATNDSLEHLDLRWNKIGALGGRALNKMLARNRKLHQLLLAGNEVEFHVLKEMECKTRDNRTRTHSVPKSQVQVDPFATSIALDSFTIHSLDSLSQKSSAVQPTSSNAVHPPQPSNMPEPSPIPVQRHSVDQFSLHFLNNCSQTSPTLGRRGSRSTVVRDQTSKLPESKFDSISTGPILQTSPTLGRRGSRSSVVRDQTSTVPESKFDSSSTDLITQMIRKMLSEGFSESHTQQQEWVQKIHHSVDYQQQQMRQIFQEEKERLEHTIQQLEDELSTRELEVCNIRQSYEQKIAGLEHVIRSLQSVSSTSEVKQQIDQQSSLEAMVTSLHATRLQLQEEIQELKTTQRKHQADEKRALDENEHLQTECERLRGEIKEERRRAHESHLAEIQLENEKRTAVESRLRGELAAALDEVVTTRQAMDTRLQTETLRLRQDTESMRARMTEEISNSERSEAAVKEHRETINRLQQDNSKLQQNIADLEAELVRKCNEIDLIERKIASLEDQLEIEQRNAKALVEQVKDTKIVHETECIRLRDVARKELQELRIFSAERTAEVEEVVKRRDATITALNQEKEDISTRYQQFIKELEDKLRDSNGCITKHEIENRRLENVLAEKTVEITGLQATVDQERGTKEAIQAQLQSELSKHQAKVQDLYEQHAAKEAEHSTTLRLKENKITCLEEEVRELKMKASQLREKSTKQMDQLQRDLNATVRSIFESRAQAFEA
uniref:Uncharacterized protein n=1 Tax=Eutreptiella gymnastica TaxID=73025 RepID=A0A7S1IGA3_9EUGL